MYNVSFTSLKSALELNKLSEVELVKILQSSMTNLNYRSNYNKQKNEILKKLNSHPEVKKLRESFKAKVG